MNDLQQKGPFTGVPGRVIQRVVGAGISYTIAPGLVTGLEYERSRIRAVRRA